MCVHVNVEPPLDLPASLFPCIRRANTLWKFQPQRECLHGFGFHEGFRLHGNLFHEAGFFHVRSLQLLLSSNQKGARFSKSRGVG